jgi:sialic acid synthase SpsE
MEKFMSVKVVAEIGSNFEPSNLESAVEMVRVAAECGADAVKFQNLEVDAMDRPDWWKEKCKPWEIPYHWWLSLMDEAKAQGVELFFSAFTTSAVDDARVLRLPIIKVASSEIGNQKLLRWINSRSTIRNVYLSVDHTRQGAVIPALTWLPDCRVTLLHCVADYPAYNARLENLEMLKEFGLPVGWSSHVPYHVPTERLELNAIEAAREAVALGAVVVEAHLRTMAVPLECPDYGPWALYPGELKPLVKAVKE